MSNLSEERCKDCWGRKRFPKISSSRKRSVLGIILIWFFAADFAGIAFFVKPTPIAAACLYLGSIVLVGWSIWWFIKEGIGRSKYCFVRGDREHLHRRKPQVIDPNGSIHGQGVVHRRLFEGHVLQLHHGGWFRRCRVLVVSDTDKRFAHVTSWKIRCWLGDHDIYLTDQRGQVRGPFSATDALRIVTSYYSFECLDKIIEQRLAALQIALSFLWQMQLFLAEGRKGTGWGDSKYARLMKDAIGLVQESIRNQLLRTESGDAVTHLMTPESNNSARLIIETLIQPTSVA